MEKFIASLDENDFDVDAAIVDVVDGVNSGDSSVLEGVDDASGSQHAAAQLQLSRNWKRKLHDFKACKEQEVGSGKCDEFSTDLYRYSFAMIQRSANTIDKEWNAFDDCAVKNPKDPRPCVDAFRDLWRKYDLELQHSAAGRRNPLESRRKADE